jgi:RimJ/RimL family protein N-acetyltransferase
MQAAIDWAKQVGAHRLSLTVFPHNHAARALYAKFGFMTEGTLRKAIRRQNGELWDAVVMGLLLDTDPPATTRRPSLHPPDGGLGAGHLLLRPARLADLEALALAVDDPEIHRWLDDIPDPYTSEAAHAFLAQVRRQWADGTGAPFVITEAGAIVGSIGLSLDRRVDGLAEVGYWVARAARGRGVATTALLAVVGWAFETLGLRRIELLAAVENTASLKVAERAGFQLEGVKRSWRLVHGVPTDFTIYARVAEQ